MTFDDMAATGTIDMRAAPAAVYELISNITRIGEWSPECKEAAWADGPGQAKVGQQFRGTNRIGDFEWTTTCEVTAADPAAKFAWQVDGGSGDGHAAEWTYEITAVDGGTRVTESFAIGPSAGGFRRFGKGKTDEESAALAANRVEQLTAAIATTLANLKAIAEG